MMPVLLQCLHNCDMIIIEMVDISVRYHIQVAEERGKHALYAIYDAKYL
jgi:hypothetical protein